MTGSEVDIIGNVASVPPLETLSPSPAMLVTYGPAWAANAQLQLIAEDAAAAEFNMPNLFMDDDAGVFEIYSAPDEWLAHETDERIFVLYFGPALRPRSGRADF